MGKPHFYPQKSNSNNSSSLICTLIGRDHNKSTPYNHPACHVRIHNRSFHKISFHISLFQKTLFSIKKCANMRAVSQSCINSYQYTGNRQKPLRKQRRWVLINTIRICENPLVLQFALVLNNSNLSDKKRPVRIPCLTGL